MEFILTSFSFNVVDDVEGFRYHFDLVDTSNDVRDTEWNAGRESDHMRCSAARHSSNR